MSEKTVKQLLEEFESLKPDEPVMFSGSTTMAKGFVDARYAALVDKCIEKGALIRVGAADGTGCDLMIQQRCIDANYYNVEVFVPTKAQDRVRVLTFLFKSKFITGGFETRDNAMRVGCTRFVGFFSRDGGAASGTAANAISIAAANGMFGEGCKSLNGYAIVNYLRTLQFDDELVAKVKVEESNS